MALVLKDRVKETSTTTGTADMVLAGAETGFQPFSVIGNGNTTYYAIVGAAEWEVGLGTYSTTGPALARTTVLANSLGSTAKINFSAGTKTVFSTYPADVAVLTGGSYSDPSWITSLSETKVLPNQSGNTGKVLSTNGTQTSWVTFTGLPDQSGANGYFLTTNGTAASWVDIPDQPIINTVSPTSFNGDAGTVFTISGVGFSSGATVAFIGNDGTAYNAATTTYVNTTTLNATTATDLLVANEPYGVRVTLTTGATTTRTGLIDAGAVPAWTTASGSLGSFAETTAVSTSVTATDPDGGAITYSVASGALPSGVSLNSSTGAITGTAPSVSADTTYNFTLRATDVGSNYTDRAFSITILDNVAPVWVTAAGNIGNIYDSNRVFSTTVSATDTQAVTYSVQSGALPSGLSLAGNTGVISGTANAVGSNTTSNFTLRASDGSLFSDRAFNIVVYAPISLLYTNGQSGTFTVPTGVTSVTATVAGGGGGGSRTSCGGDRIAAGGGGGASQKVFSVSGGQNYSYAAGAGGQGYNYGGACEPAGGGTGGTSNFSTISATGGNGGRSGIPGSGYTEVGGTGGSGSGGTTNQTGGTGGTGNANGGSGGSAPALASAVGSYSTGGSGTTPSSGQSGFVRIQY